MRALCLGHYGSFPRFGLRKSGRQRAVAARACEHLATAIATNSLDQLMPAIPKDQDRGQPVLLDFLAVLATMPAPCPLSQATPKEAAPPPP
jgi:hypothetical protein